MTKHCHVNIACYRNDLQKQCIVKGWLNHHFKQESSRMRPFSPNVNVNSTWKRITGRGLSRPRGGHLSLIHITWTKCAMSSFNTNIRMQPSDWTKCKWLSYEIFSCETIMRIETISYETFHTTSYCTKCERALNQLAAVLKGHLAPLPLPIFQPCLPSLTS